MLDYEIYQRKLILQEQIKRGQFSTDHVAQSNNRLIIPPLQ